MSEQMPENFTYHKANALQRRITHAVDQVIVDGIANGTEQRVPRQMLFDITGLNPNAINIKRDFNERVTRDPRFIDLEVGERGVQLAYWPVVSDESIARASLEARIRGRGIYAPEEQLAAYEHMDNIAETLYAIILSESRDSARQNLSLSNIYSIFRDQGVLLNTDQSSAFEVFMQQDDRFSVDQPQGRVRLTEVPVRQQFRQIKEVFPAIQRSVSLNANRSGEFTQKDLTDCLQSQGVTISRAKLQTLLDSKGRELGIVVDENGKLRFSGYQAL